MKAIELSEQHKEKLLAMCEELFPEYKIVFCESLILSLSKDGEFSMYIHYFEFCTTYLAQKLLIKRGRIYANFYYSVFIRKTIHPIDYLYTQFKEI